MGMDVMGMNPINNEGETFHANLWSWRPIHYLCEYLSIKSEDRDLNLTISSRTFNRDLDEIRDIYGIDIQYDRTQKVYYIANDQVANISNVRLMEAFDIFNTLKMSEHFSDFILFEERKSCFAIKEIIIKDSKLKKSIKYNEYKFITVDFSKKKPKFKTNSFNSNLELLHLLRENLACNLEYQRFFQINAILK